MAIIVRAEWSPPDPAYGSYGVLGERHPQFEEYHWVEWIDETGARLLWPGLRPAEGYYHTRNLKRIGTALFA